MEININKFESFLIRTERRVNYQRPQSSIPNSHVKNQSTLENYNSL